MSIYRDMNKPTADKQPTKVPGDRDIKISSKVSPKISSEISPSVTTATTRKVVAGEYYFADSVRRAIKWPGKESAPLRITRPELDRLKAAVRYFEDKGYLTDRTQLIRVALNYMLDDFEHNGDKSFLAEILDRINNY